MATQWERNIDAELAALRRRIDQLQDRPALAGQRSQVRLAKTVVDPGDGTYPESGDSPDTYWVVFVRGTFTADTDGAVTPAYVDRQNEDEARVTAHNVRGSDTYVPEGTYVKVFWAWGRWWFSYCCEDDCPYGGPPDCQARPDGTVSWFTHEVDEETGEITRTGHSGRCITVYVNSSSGDVAETGNGTESRPFVNLNSIFSSPGLIRTGTGTLSSGVFTPSELPYWVADRLIGTTLSLDGTDYTVTANTTTTATIDDPPADGSYSWTLKIFDDDCIYNICTTTGCPKVKVLVNCQGTIDYSVLGSRDYQGNLIIEPYDEYWQEDDLGGDPVWIDWFTIWKHSLGGESIDRALGGMSGCVWKKAWVLLTLDVAYNPSNQSFLRAVRGCSYSSFDDCYAYASAYAGTDAGEEEGAKGIAESLYCAFDGTAAVGLSQGKSGHDYLAKGEGFWGCGGSTFRNCAGSGSCSGDTSLTYDMRAGYGFSFCAGSNFSGCTAYGYANGNSWLRDHIGAGFASCSDSSFYDSDGEGVCGYYNSLSQGSGHGRGFSLCTDSTFVSCTGTGTISAGGYGYASGFYANDGSIITTCGGTATSPTQAYGFYQNDFCYFDTCDGEGIVVSGLACGFYQNLCSVFIDCTTSAPVGAITCDDLTNDVEWLEETIEGVLTLAPTHTLSTPLETIEGVLSLSITHAFEL